MNWAGTLGRRVSTGWPDPGAGPVVLLNGKSAVNHHRMALEEIRSLTKQP